MARESWLRLDNDNHDQFAEAMMLCQDPSGSCCRLGFCTQDGDCFRTDVRAYKEAAKLIDAVASDKSAMVRSALHEAAAHLRTMAASAPRT